ncbi:MAG TPA: hypothetical protein VFB22_16225 [Candidatus Baltobacteraceae bacterium]|nr:hypothetical protein [Candidatus Baltobacteraceae bacterium]
MSGNRPATSPEHGSAARPEMLPERRLQRVLERFLPPRFARFVATDVTVTTHAPAGVATLLNPVPPTPYSYVRGSKIALAGVIVAVSLLPDLFAAGLLIPHRVWWAGALIVATEIWGCAWLFGLYGTMARRPHEVACTHVVLRNGIFQTVRFAPEEIETARTVGVVKRYRLPAEAGRERCVLGFGGTPLVHVVLKSPAYEEHLLLPRTREVWDVYAPSDVPQALCAALLEARRSTSNVTASVS